MRNTIFYILTLTNLALLPLSVRAETSCNSITNRKIIGSSEIDRNGTFSRSEVNSILKERTRFFDAHCVDLTETETQLLLRIYIDPHNPNEPNSLFEIIEIFSKQ